MSERAWMFALLILAIAALARLPALDADPPPSMQFHFITDEGQYAHNARQMAILGRWVEDEHNAALYTAPLHSFLLERTYASFGTSLASTRLPGALAGVLTSILLFVLLRGPAGAGVAATAGILCALSVFLVANARVAFTESLQLTGVTLATLGVWRAAKRPAWGVVAAIGLLIAMAAKLSSLPLVAVLGAQWSLMATDARRDGTWRLFMPAAMSFAVTLAVAGVLGAVWILPRMTAFLPELEGMGRLAVAALTDMSILDRALWLGYRDDPAGLRVPGGLFMQDPALVLGAGWLGTAGLLGWRVPGDRFLNFSCWLWIGLMLAAITSHPSLSPDRRYVLLVPPMMILLAQAAFGHPGSAPSPEGRVGVVRTMLAWALATLTLSWFVRPFMALGLELFASDLLLGVEEGLSSRGQLAAGWIVSMVLAGAMVAAGPVRRTLRPERDVARILCAWAVVAGVLQIGAQVLAPRFTMRDAGREIAALAREVPVERRIVLGATAETFSLEGDLRAMVVRDWSYAGVRVNLDAVEKIDPPFAILTRADGRLVTGNEGFGVEGAVPVGSWQVWHDARGRARFEVTLYARPSEAKVAQP